ncbi:hypothetical protein FisN_2Hh239 [Fistulifera solaris]|uniref:F-box domain-containing protein n=1 Tax=Fistulifera solaris TaxID=1519565 RepID=A0A1Z5JF68_FISSO|nr:hypothetical protein FisN_2Hh239 [Fistulifera solaris]|eukprot:GAX12408.1 hypothetical protein FisN_2Hh239 [Fistulifera solaris]
MAASVTLSNLSCDDNEYSSTFTLSQLPEELLFRTFSFLDVISLIDMGMTNHYYHALCQRNQAGWTNLCLQLWKTKIHVAPAARSLVQEHALAAYRLACADATQRSYVTKPEFCYNPDTHQGTVWSFRFKESAGTDWTSVDPWYRGLPCRQMVFLESGKGMQYVNDDEDSPRLLDPPVPIAWRFLTRPMDLPERPLGSYVRFTVAGRDVPTYSVRRSPNGNWGFVMESCWGLYASYPLPPRRKKILRRAGEEPTWVHADEEDWTCWRNKRIRTRRHLHATLPHDPLQDDSQLLITNEIQWREAFLYNVGARVLPEGDQAIDEFDRAWGGV